MSSIVWLFEHSLALPFFGIGMKTGGSVGKKTLSAKCETWVPSLGRVDPLEKEMAIYSSIPAWEIPWTEEPGGLQSKGSQRAGHD